jgi:4a-hydroxytetrahydrobiopterin dehydratase
MSQRVAPECLQGRALTSAVRMLPPVRGHRWSLQEGHLGISLAFDDFPQAFAFMTVVAIHAERMDHHPEWHNVHRKLRIRLTTHESGGITERDLALARSIASIKT